MTKRIPLSQSPFKQRRAEKEAFLAHAVTYTGRDCLLWPFGRGGDGYGQMRIDKQTVRVPRYICEQAHGPAPSPKHHAAHSCGNGHLGCINPTHLRWATAKENLEDAVQHGTRGAGERANRLILSEKQVIELRRKASSQSIASLAREYGLSHSGASKIVHRRTWRYI